MKKRRLSQLDARILAILFSAAAVLAFSFFHLVEMPNLDSRITVQQSIVDGTAGSPYRYRVLVPFLTEGLARLLVVVMPYRTAFLAAHATYNVLTLTGILWAMHVFLRQWFTTEQALAGVLFTAAVMPVALRDQVYQPWSLLETLLFTLSLLWIRRDRLGWLAVAVVLGALNRETALFIPVVYGLTRVDFGSLRRGKIDRAAWLSAAGGLLWLAVFGALRLARGPAEPVISVAEIWQWNRGNLLKSIPHLILFLGVFWWFALRGVRGAPPFLRRAAVVTPLYLAPMAVYGVWYETRLLMPLYAIFIGLGLAHIFGRDEHDTPQPA